MQSLVLIDKQGHILFSVLPYLQFEVSQVQVLEFILPTETHYFANSPIRVVSLVRPQSRVPNNSSTLHSINQ